MISAFINNQTLRVKAPTMVAGTKNYFSADFHFSAEWDGLKKTAYFRQGDTLHSADLTADRLEAGVFPDLSAGSWEFFIWGFDEAGHQRITTNIYTLNVKPYYGAPE